MICDKCSANMEERTIYMTPDGVFCRRCYPIIEKNQSSSNLNTPSQQDKNDKSILEQQDE